MPSPVSINTALESENVPLRSVLDLLRIPAGILQSFRSRRAVSRKNWLRFVAVRVGPLYSAPMEPILTPDSIAVIDRHYNSLNPYQPSRPTLYAVRHGSTMLIRYLDYEADRLILRPHRLAFPIILIQLGVHQSPSDLIIGRVCYLFVQP